MIDLTQHQKDILIAFANNDMKIHRTAKQLHYARGTIEHHLNAIKKATDIDPRTFRGLMSLIFKIRSETLVNMIAKSMHETVDKLCTDDSWILCGEGKPAN